MTLTEGTRLGPYEVGAVIGSGGMGVVYRARDTRLDRDVALKVLQHRRQRDPDAVTRFERESRAVAALSHPNIVAIHDVGTHEGLPYAVSELLEGQPLRDRLRDGPLPWREAAQVGVAVADGLSAAHGRGIVHRDLKPENLFVTAEGRVKILDFGLAWWGGEVGPVTSPASSPTQLAGDGAGVVGTIGYMSPEQARGLPVGPESDIFSLGCVLYELVTGRRPFERATASDTLAALLTDTPERVAASGRHVPFELSRLIAHCLEKAPERRFRSARDLEFALRGVLADSDVVRGMQRRPGGRGRARSIAVLPFANLSGDRELDYLGDGLAESLINTLAQVPRLRVVPRATVFRYKGRDISSRAAGVELNADLLLTGRVLQRGDRLDVQAELVDTSTESQLWGQRYGRALDDAFAVQEEIAREIAGAMRLKFAPASRGLRKVPAPARQAPDPEAYRAYLRGRHLWSKWTAEGFRRAAEWFQQAIDRDPAYAAAWAGLADVYGAAAFYGYMPAGEVLPRARAAAKRALELDPDLAEAHATLAVDLLFFDWDLPGAERAATRAVRLDPAYATGHAYHALVLACRGRLAEALDAAQRAETLDPLSLLAASTVAWVQMFAGDAAAALGQVHHILDLDPKFPEARGLAVWIYESTGHYEPAAREARAWLPVFGLPAEAADRLAEAFAARGERGYWEERLALIDQIGTCGGQSAFYTAAVLMSLGRSDEALGQLEDATAGHEGSLVFLRVHPAFTTLHGTPRFEALAARVGV